MLRRNMRDEFVSVEELMAQLREQGLEDCSGVKAAYMEADGSSASSGATANDLAPGRPAVRSSGRITGPSLAVPEDSMNVATPPKPASVESTVPRLTELARFAGCAAKISQADLHKALAGLPVAADPRVLVGHDTSDDAAIIKLRDDLALVETVDIFPPIVDDALRLRPHRRRQRALRHLRHGRHALERAELRRLAGRYAGHRAVAPGARRRRRDLQGGRHRHLRRPFDRRRGTQVRPVRHRHDRPAPHRLQRRRPPGRRAGADQADRHRRADHGGEAQRRAGERARRGDQVDDDAEPRMPPRR